MVEFLHSFHCTFKRFPFATNNPIGYLIAFAIEYIMFGYGFFAIACTLALGIGAFWFAITASKEIRLILHSINDEAHAKKRQPNKTKELISKYVDIHSAVKQFSIFAIFQ